MSNLGERIWSKVTKWFQSEDTETRELNMGIQGPETTPNRRGLKTKLSRLHEYRIDLEMKEWRLGVAWAEDRIRPRRNTLYRVYHRAMEDDHLLAQVRTAIFTVRTGNYKVERNGQEVEELSTYFARPWFRDFLQYAVEAELWGHSLVEFDPGSMEQGEFQHLDLIPRLHVRPEYGEVVLNETDEKGIDFRKAPVNKYLVEIGGREDLGLLKVASRAIIRKDYSMGDWSRRNEKFGQPLLVVRTASRNEQELNEKQRMAENFGTNLWAILDDQDQIDLVESNQAFTFQTFQNMADRIDKAISILVNGQTGTTEEKSYVGSAEVHERILNTYTKDRLHRIQDLINWKLIPFLTRHGYPLAGCEFKFLDLEEQSTMPDTSDAGDEQQLSLPKKKSPVAVPLTPIYNKVCCGDDLQLALDNSGLDKIVQAAIRKVYDKRLQAGDVDADTWKHNVEQLWAAAQEGTGKSFPELEYTDTTFELLAQLRSNIQVFAAFKNHQEIAEMAAALIDANNQVRSFDDFREVAQMISTNYNESWLSAEYNTAVGTAQMANKWADYQANADVLPMLKYITQQDDRVRASHAAMDGTTLPIDDPFWDEFYPPNGWNCRCTVQQVAEQDAVQPDRLPTDEETPLVFRHNAGKDGQVFTARHPYFLSVTDSAQRERLQLTAARLSFDNYDGRKVYYNEQTGGFVVSQSGADSDLENLGQLLAQAGEQIELLSEKPDLPNLLRNGLVWLGMRSKSVTVEAIAGSKARRLLIELEENADLATAREAARQGLADNTEIQEVQFLFTDGLIETFTRDTL